MTYEDFLKLYNEKLPTKNEYLRDGQFLMILLAEVWMEEYKAITATEFDCFYVDAKIPKTLEHLEKVWLNH